MITFKSIKMLECCKIQIQMHMQVHVACSSLVIFIYLACERRGSIYHAVRLG